MLRTIQMLRFRVLRVWEHRGKPQKPCSATRGSELTRFGDQQLYQRYIKVCGKLIGIAQLDLLQ